MGLSDLFKKAKDFAEDISEDVSEFENAITDGADKIEDMFSTQNEEQKVTEKDSSSDVKEGESLLDFFKSGGVYLFDEEDGASENTFYKVEELMGTEAGAEISETTVDEEIGLGVFHDASILDSNAAIAKYKAGDYKKVI